MSNTTLLDEARRLLASGDAASAAAKAEEALAAGAPRADVLRVKATALLQLGRPAEAETPLRELCELRPDDPWAYVMLGRLHLAAGRVGKAQAMAERAAILDPDSAETRALRQDLMRAAPSVKARPRRKLPVVPIVAAAAVLVAAFLLWWFLVHARAGAGVQQAQVPGPGQPQVQQAQPEGPGQPEVQQAPPQAPGQPQVTEAPPPLPGQPQVTQAPPEQPGQTPLTQGQPGPASFRVTWGWEFVRQEPTMEGQVQRVYRIYGQVVNDGGRTGSAVLVGRMKSGGETTGYAIHRAPDLVPGQPQNYEMVVRTSPRSQTAGVENDADVIAGELTKNVDAMINMGDMAALAAAMGTGLAGQ